MENIYGVAGIRVKIIIADHDDDRELNKFLAEHDGKIVNIQIAGMSFGLCTFVITYIDN